MFQHTKILCGDVSLPPFVQLTVRQASQYTLTLFFFSAMMVEENVMYSYGVGSPLLVPETRGLSLMHRDNIGGPSRVRTVLPCVRKKRQIEKFIFNGHQSFFAPPAFSDPMKTSGVCSKITSIFPAECRFPKPS